MSDDPSTPGGEATPGPYVPPPAVPGRPPSPGPYPGAPSGYGPPPAYGVPPGYGQPGYGDPYGYGAPARNGFGVAALVLGVIGLVSSLFVVGIVPGVLAVVFGVLGRGRARRREATNGGMATAGLVLGILAVIAGIAFIGLYVYVNKNCVDVGGHLHCNDPNYPTS